MRLFIAGKQKVESVVAENGILPNLEITRVDVSEQGLVDLATMARAGMFLLLGDHVASFSVIKEIKDKVGMIIFDAHIGALPVDISHDSYLRHVSGLTDSVILVGLRDLTLSELEFLREKNIRYFSMHSISMEGLSSVCDSIMGLAKDWPGTFVSVSLDVLDPAFAKVSRPSVGGLSTRQLLYFVQRLRMLRNFLAAGVLDSDKSLPLACKVLVEFAAKPSKPF